jgi:hypothetical protein
VAARIVRAWRGVIRGQIQQCLHRTTALLAYNTKHPLVGFLLPTQVSSLQSAQAVCQALLAETKPR